MLRSAHGTVSMHYPGTKALECSSTRVLGYSSTRVLEYSSIQLHTVLEYDNMISIPGTHPGTRVHYRSIDITVLYSSTQLTEYSSNRVSSTRLLSMTMSCSFEEQTNMTKSRATKNCRNLYGIVVRNDIVRIALRAPLVINITNMRCCCSLLN